MMIKTASAKNKARNLQNYVRDRILEKFPWLGENDVRSQSMGAAGIDIPLSPLARKTFPLSIECKKTKKAPSRKEYLQARNNAYIGTTPAIVWAPHGCGPSKSMIIFDYDDFLNFYEEVASAHLTALENDFYEKNSN